MNFRVSDEEYEALEQACIAEGARSISDFTRSAVQRAVRGSGTLTAQAAARVIDEKLRQLRRDLMEISGLVNAALRDGTR